MLVLNHFVLKKSAEKKKTVHWKQNAYERHMRLEPKPIKANECMQVAMFQYYLHFCIIKILFIFSNFPKLEKILVAQVSLHHETKKFKLQDYTMTGR